MLWAYPQEASRFFGMLSHLMKICMGSTSDGIPGSSWGYDGAYQVMGLWYNGICQVWGNGPRSPTQLNAPNSAAMLFQEALPVVAKALASKAPTTVELETAEDTKVKYLKCLKLQLQTSQDIMSGKLTV